MKKVFIILGFILVIMCVFVLGDAHYQKYLFKQRKEIYTQQIPVLAEITEISMQYSEGDSFINEPVLSKVFLVTTENYDHVFKEYVEYFRSHEWHEDWRTDTNAHFSKENWSVLVDQGYKENTIYIGLGFY